MTSASRLARKARGFAGLDFRDQLAIARLLPRALAVEIGLRTLSPTRLARLLRVRLADGNGGVPDAPEPPAFTAREARTLRAAKNLFASWPSAGPCFRRSLVLASALGARDPVIHIGAKRRGGELDAHAWVEIDGHPVGEDPESAGYRPLRNPPAPPPARLNPHHLASNLRLRAELLRIADAFEQEGIDYIVLKGIPLAVRLSRRLDERAILDNDILVCRRDAARACGVLKRLGYEPPPYLELESQLRSTFQYPMRRRFSEGSALAELHWNAFPPTHFRVPESLLWSDVDQVPVEGRSIPVLGPALTLLQLASHFVQHRLSEPRILDDLGRAWDLWEPELDATSLLTKARAIGASSALAYSLSAAHQLGYARTRPLAANPAGARILRRILPPARLLDARPEKDHVRDLQALFLVHPRRYPEWLRFHLFPPSDTMTAIHDGIEGRGLYLRYAARAFRPLGRALRGGSRVP